MRAQHTWTPARAEVASLVRILALASAFSAASSGGTVLRVLVRRLVLPVIPSLMLGGPTIGLSAVAQAAPTRVVPPKKSRKEKRAEREQRDLSEAGERRGAIELTLGSLMAATSVLLIGRGGWELARARSVEGACQSANPPLECELDPNPARGNQIAAGLSFGFAVPFAVASGFLLAYGVRIHRDWRSYRREHGQARLMIRPWGAPTGGGMHLRLRF